MTASSGKEARANGREWTSYESGMCLQWVRSKCWEIPGVYASAIEAWNGARDKHPGDRNPPIGAPLFYRGGQYGHIVTAEGEQSGDQRGTDCTTTGRVSEAAISWPETSWGYEYLGWTGDLNGIDLPLGDEDEMTPDDWDKLRSIVADEIEEAWQKEQSNGDGRSENLNTAGNVRKIVREELNKAGL